MKLSVFVLPMILPVVLLLWIFGAGAEVADGQQAQPKESLIATACTTAYQVAALAGVNPERCRVVSQVDDGQDAFITVKVKITGKGWFAVALAYQRTVWSQSAILITPITG